jgi:peptide/nickel transport system substrate-binding protein
MAGNKFRDPTMPSHRWLIFGLLTIVLCSSGWLGAQPPRKEEEEEAKEKTRPVVPVPIEPAKKDGPPPAVAPDVVDSDVGTFRDEEKKAKNAAAREMFRLLAVPYDRLTSTFAGGKTLLIELLKNRELPEEEFEIRVLTPSRKESSKQTLATGSGFQYTPFELIVVEYVDNFLARDSGLSKDRQLDYAARALTAGLRDHYKFVNSNKRVGKAWETVEKTLREKLIRIQRERFALLLADKAYEAADELGLKMLSRYPDNNDIRKDVYGLQLQRSNVSLKDPSDAELMKLRESLLLYEQIPGTKDNGLINSVRSRLKSRSATLVSMSNEAAKNKKTAEALALLRQAEALDPDGPGIANARNQLRGQVLYVGVAKLPERMSPAAATEDSERWAAELMFEGLLQAIPDPDAIRYRPALAETLPAVMPLGRSFTLPHNIHWTRDGLEAVDARDVRGTLDLVGKAGYRERWCFDGLDVFHAIDRIDDTFRLRLAYNRGVLEPLGRATFKIIPARYLQEQGLNADDPAFAKNPFGTGPFKYDGRESEGVGEAKRECAVFRANPHYGQRPGKFGLPWIREIRFYVPTQSTIGKDVSAEQLHIYPDAPSEFVARFRTESSLNDKMRVYPAKTDRRIHLLAINHRQTDLQNEKLRQGLSAAINRDAILKDVYLSGKDEKTHGALTGPFPLKSWATPPTAKDAPLFKPGAGGLIDEGRNGRTIKLKLLFPAEDPKNLLVCQKIKAQIEEASADKSGKPQVTIELTGLSATEFRVKLNQEHGYDLALTNFDYRDDLYSLGSLLDPEAAGKEGRNLLGYLAGGSNPAEGDRRLRRLIDEVRQYRDFGKEVKERTWDIHTLFNQRVPFVPLWQLDRNMILHKDLKLFFDNPDAAVHPDQLDPATIFTGVEMWRLD